KPQRTFSSALGSALVPACIFFLACSSSQGGGGTGGSATGGGTGSGTGGSGAGGTTGTGGAGTGTGGSATGGTGTASGGAGGASKGSGGSGGSVTATGGSGAGGAAGMGGSGAGGSGLGGSAAGGAGTGGGGGTSSAAVYNPDFVEFSGSDCNVATPKDVSISGQLPNLFTKLDGTTMSKRSDWRCRRAEMKAVVEKYIFGAKPGPPTTVTGSVSSTQIKVHVENGGKSIDFTVPITLPPGANGPVPIII